MATGRITKRSVDAVRPQSKDAFLWDEDLTGFGLKVTPSGRKVYIAQYYLAGRKRRTRRITLGQHGTVTPEEARSEAKRLLGIAASGKDPAAEKDAAREVPTVAEVGEQFIEQHVEAKLKPRTAVEYRHALTAYVLPVLADKPLDQLKRADIAKLHHSLADRPYAANRTLAFLSKMMNWCEMVGLRPDGSNPCRHVEKYPEKKRERFLSESELATLGDTLAAIESENRATPWAVAAVRLLALTGARLNEVLTLRWEWVDFDSGTIRLPDSKTGAKTIYLNPPALQVLNDVPRLENNPHVICGDKPGAHLVNLQKPWRRIRKEAGLDDVRLHDLRHSFASVAVAGGMSLPLIGALLGHSQPQTTARYAHLSADPLKAASAFVANKIEYRFALSTENLRLSKR